MKATERVSEKVAQILSHWIYKTHEKLKCYQPINQNINASIALIYRGSRAVFFIPPAPYERYISAQNLAF